MKIILDTDGTLTDFNKFVKDNAIEYFKNKYSMQVVYPEKLEIQDIFDMDNFFKQKYNCDDAVAQQMTKKALDKFWVSLRFVKFTLLDRFRPGVTKYINQKLKEGHKIEIHTSRSKTCEDSIIGSIARKFTILQYAANGILLPSKCFHFYENDDEKVKGIIDTKPDLVFDDKKEIVDLLSSKGIKTICVEGNHNKDVEVSKNVEKIVDFNDAELDEKIQNLIGKINSKYYDRAAASDKFFDKLKVLKPLIDSKFKPIILNEHNIRNFENESVVYAPNHRSTLDPIVITGVLLQNIHWAALLRFFKGEDSIFNNSKNPILCKITSQTFKKMEYFPIDRKSDNSNANNFESIKDMNNFLKIHQKIGIFGEGTTRRPEGQDFGTFDDSFILMARRNNSWIQPITTLWIKELGLKPKVIINFGEPFKVGNMTTEEAMEHFMKIQKESLEENKTYCSELSKKVKGR